MERCQQRALGSARDATRYLRSGTTKSSRDSLCARVRRARARGACAMAGGVHDSNDGSAISDACCEITMHRDSRNPYPQYYLPE